MTLHLTHLEASKDSRLISGGGTNFSTGSHPAIENQLDGYFSCWRTLHVENISITGRCLMCDQRLGQTGKWIFSNDIVATAGSDLRQRENGQQPPGHIHPGDICQVGPVMSGCHNTTLTTT